jgi:hypothetical protein
VNLAAHGISVDVPSGWEARIIKRGQGAILHVATFPLHASDGDFGAAATERIRHGDAFAALVEYVDPAMIHPATGLYAASRPPVPRLHEFGPTTLQVTRPGQLGWQRFFTEADRTCALYAVIKPGAERPEKLVRRLAGVLSTLRIHALT